MLYSKTCANGHSKIDKTMILLTNGSLMKVKSMAECSPWSILQYFRPALSDNWYWKHILGLFESGRFTQVLLYILVDDLSHIEKMSCRPMLNQYLSSA